MDDANQRNDGRCIVRKDLDDLDRTNGDGTGHYSWREVAHACDADAGVDHDE